jgi:hypothetical protein
MSPTVVNAVATLEDPSQYSIRYGIENDRFAHVFSSVSSRSVLLLGVARDETRRPAEAEPLYSLIAVITLPAPVDPGQTVVIFEGNDLVLRLTKRRDCQSEDCQSEEARVPNHRVRR